MACKNCGSTSTIKAHLIPASFCRDIKADGGAMAHISPARDGFLPTQSGLFDTDLTCHKCDNKIGLYEKYVVELLRKLGAQAMVPGRQYGCDADIEMVRKFCASLIWKFSVTTKADRIHLGDWEPILRRYVFNNGKADHLDAVLIAHRHENPDALDFYATPSLRKHGAARICTFYVGGFTFIVKLGKSPWLADIKPTSLRNNPATLRFHCVDHMQSPYGQKVKEMMGDTKLATFLFRQSAVGKEIIKAIQAGPDAVEAFNVRQRAQVH